MDVVFISGVTDFVRWKDVISSEFQLYAGWEGWQQEAMSLLYKY